MICILGPNICVGKDDGVPGALSKYEEQNLSVQNLHNLYQNKSLSQFPKQSLSQFPKKFLHRLKKSLWFRKKPGLLEEEKLEVAVRIHPNGLIVLQFSHMLKCYFLSREEAITLATALLNEAVRNEKKESKDGP